MILDDILNNYAQSLVKGQGKSMMAAEGMKYNKGGYFQDLYSDVDERMKEEGERRKREERMMMGMRAKNDMIKLKEDRDQELMEMQMGSVSPYADITSGFQYPSYNVEDERLMSKQIDTFYKNKEREEKDQLALLDDKDRPQVLYPLEGFSDLTQEIEALQQAYDKLSAEKPDQLEAQQLILDKIEILQEEKEQEQQARLEKIRERKEKDRIREEIFDPNISQSTFAFNKPMQARPVSNDREIKGVTVSSLQDMPLLTQSGRPVASSPGSGVSTVSGSGASGSSVDGTRGGGFFYDNESYNSYLNDIYAMNASADKVMERGGKYTYVDGGKF